MSEALVVLERGLPVAFSFDDIMRYHGPGSPGGVAHAFKVLERGLPLLGPDARVERREIEIETAFGGPGARDAFELVTRAVTEGRYTVDPSMARAGGEHASSRFVFRLRCGDRAVTLGLRDGYVTDEFAALAGAAQLTEEDGRRLARLKLEMAEHVMSARAEDVYDELAG